MRLERIYSSRLYVTNARKDKIHAAIQNPINAELVQQLSDYLDDDAKVKLERAQKTTELDQISEQSEEHVTPSATAPMGGGGPSSSSFSGSAIDDFGDDELADIEPSDFGDEGGDETPAPETDVEESTKVDSTPVTATSIIWTTPEDIVSECDTIHGTLNARDDTKGVIRLQVKDSELWIYFNDDVNLNDTMIAVIEVLNSTGYTYLKFNRLARSNNAIVFDINLNYQDDIKSKKDLEEK